jgi:hypothetical protein
MSKMNRAEALRGAELKVVRAGGERPLDPFYRAGFVPIGDAN